MHYWADLQLVHGFSCYDNTHICKLIALYTANAYSTEREMSGSACTRSMASLFSRYYLTTIKTTTSVFLVNLVG